MQHLVGEHAHIVFRLTLPDNGSLVAATIREVAVEAVIRHVQLTTFKPFDLRLVKIPFQDLVPFLIPGNKFLGSLSPIPIRIIHGTLIGSTVFVHRLCPV